MPDEKFIKMCPLCEICGDHITDDYVRRIENRYYHDSCIEEVSLETYLQNLGEDDVYEGEY